MIQLILSKKKLISKAMMRTHWMVLCYTCLLFMGCDIQATSISSTISNFTTTDASGTVLSVDTDDWRTQALYVNKITVSPAYANPTSSGIIYLRLSTDLLYPISGLSIYLQTSTDTPPILLRTITNVPQFSFLTETINLSTVLNVSEYSGKLFRLLIYEGSLLVSYGDIKIN